jgi:hypothetical protein
MTMLIVTLISVVVAVVSSIVAWRVLRRERVRSDARVSLLASAIDEGDSLEEAFDWPDEEEETRVAALSLPFAEHPASDLRRRPLITAAAGLAAVLAVVVLIAMTGNRHEASTAPAVAPPEALELLSTRDAREGATLAITGLVRNRLEGPSDALTAVVSVLDQNGQVVGSGSTGLGSIAPGDESLFVVTIPRATDVVRYRVSFRSHAGAVRHIDRRSNRVTNVS